MVDSIRFAQLIKKKFQESMDSNWELKKQLEKLRQTSQHAQQSSLPPQQSCLEPEELHQPLETAAKETQRFEEPLNELTRLLSGLRSETYEDVAETDACTNLLETEPTDHKMNDLRPAWPEVPAELTLKEASLDWTTVAAELAKIQSDTVESLHKDAEDTCEHPSGSIEPETEPVSNASDDLSGHALTPVFSTNRFRALTPGGKAVFMRFGGQV